LLKKTKQIQFYLTIFNFFNYQKKTKIN